jgi:hypothetical protein
MKLQIIKKDNGLYFVQHVGNSGLTCMTHDKYLNTYDDALAELKNIKNRDLKLIKDNQETIVYEESY